METTRKPDSAPDPKSNAKTDDKADPKAQPTEPRFAENVQDPMINPRPGQQKVDDDKAPDSAVEPRRMPPPVESVSGNTPVNKVDPTAPPPGAEDRTVIPATPDMVQRSNQLPELSEPAGPPPNSPYRTGVAGEFPETRSTTEGIKLMIPEGHYAVRHTSDPNAAMSVGQPGPRGIWFIPFNAITQAWAHGFEKLSDRDIEMVAKEMEISAAQDGAGSDDTK
jgi:hypothetical protein